MRAQVETTFRFDAALTFSAPPEHHAKNDGTREGLLRSEVASFRAGQLGRVSLQPFRGQRAATLAIGLGIVLVAAVLSNAHYTRKATVTGWVVPAKGLTRLIAPAAGELMEAPISEGQSARAGQALFVIANGQFSAQGDTQASIERQIGRRSDVVERSRALALRFLHEQETVHEARRSALAASARQLDEELSLAQRRVGLAESQLSRQQDLARDGFVARAQVQQAESDVLAVRAQAQSLVRAKTDVLKEQAESLAAIVQARRSYQTEVSALDNNQALLRQEAAENASRARSVVRAPMEGAVAGIAVRPGQRVAAGDVLASLVPSDAELVVHLYAGAKQAGFVRAGQEVALRFAAFPYQKFGMGRGRVVSVSQTSYALAELPIAAQASIPTATASTSYLQIVVALQSPFVQAYGKSEPLKAGMMLEADIIQDRRHVYEWLLEPIFSVTGKWSSP